MKRFLLLIGIIAGLGLAAAGGYLAGTRLEPKGIKSTQAPDSKNKRKILYYRNPMNPAITSPVPAKDQMGMDYVPVYADEKGTNEPPGTVRIDPVMVQDMGVRTEVVRKITLGKMVRGYGRVAYNENNLLVIHPKFKGWIEEQFVSKTGEHVKKGQPLLSVYSPELVASQEEYLLAMASEKMLSESPIAVVRNNASSLTEASRRRLELFDIPESAIQELEKSGRIKKAMVINAPATGTVLMVGVRPGAYVTPVTDLYRIADLSTVWVYGNIFEPDLDWIRLGDKAVMKIAAAPGRTFRGKIDFIYPYEQGKTRTVRIRLLFENPGMVLKPGMFANITITARARHNVLAVPSEAIIRSGEQDQVFIEVAPGRFEPRLVTLGIEARGFTQILSGVKQGEKVVTSAQFLIDSESKLKEATYKMIAPKGNTGMGANTTGMNKAMKMDSPK